MLSYRRILKQALDISWRYKKLWFFGLFASLIGFNAEYQVTPGRNGGLVFNSPLKNWLETDIFGYIGQLFSADFSRGFIFLIACLIFLALGLLLVWLAVSSQAAIIESNKKLMLGTKKISINEELKNGSHNFWPVLLLNIFSKLITVAALSIIALPVLLSLKFPICSEILYIVFFIIFVALAIAGQIIIKYAINSTVIFKTNIGQSLKAGHILLKKNWLISIEIIIILFLINIGVALAVFICLFAILSPMLLLAILAYQFLAGAALWIIMAIAFLICIVFLGVVGAMLTSFHISSWSNLFLQLQEKGSKAKLERLFGKK